MNPTLRSAVAPRAFEERYRTNPDPWNYGASPYERAKYQVTVAALSRPRYESALEAACSVGELTSMLVPRCGRLLATDVSATAVRRARQRCADLENVRIECQDLRSQPRGECFDLIVVSEVGYYFGADVLAGIACRLGESLRNGGELLAVHWRGHSADHVLHGDEVHQVLRRALQMQPARSELHPGYRLDSWLKT
jgi:SAM-dependent methyltransferase